MKYTVNESSKTSILKLIDYLFNNVRDEGGDGDALWCSRFFDIEDIFILVKEYNNNLLEQKWDLKLENDMITWWLDQSYIQITNDVNLFKVYLETSQCSILW